MTARMPGSDAQDMALKQLFMMVHQQGVVMASPTCSCCSRLLVSSVFARLASA